MRTQQLPPFPERQLGHRLLFTLPWLGAVPFVGCAILSVAGVESLGPLGEVDALLAAYGLAIAAFMAGTHWGCVLRAGGASLAGPLVASNVLTVAMWLAFVLATPALALITVAAGLCALLAVDRSLLRHGLIDAAYLRMRVGVTALVVAAIAAFVVVRI